MAGKKISAPVGLSPRESRGDPVKNNPKDVELVRDMLRANGFDIQGGTTVDKPMLKYIAFMQKRAGVKPIDYVVDPGGLTDKKMRKLYDKQVAELGTGEVVKLVSGKNVIVVSKADYEKIKKEAAKELLAYGRVFRTTWKICDDLRAAWQGRINGAEGVLMSVSSILVVGSGHLVGAIKLPDMRLFGKAMKAIEAAEAAAKAADMEKANKLFPQAEAATNKLIDDMERFCRETSLQAKRIHGGLELTQTAGWTIVGVLAAPTLISVGATAGTAAIMGSAGTAFLKTGVNELGKGVSGNSKGAFDAAWNIAMDTLIGAGTGALTANFKGEFLDKCAKWAAPKLAAHLGGSISKKVAEKYIVLYFKTAGKTALLSAGTETMKLNRKLIEEGKLTAKDFQNSAYSIIFGAVLSVPFAALSRWQRAWYDKNRPKFLADKMVPLVMKESSIEVPLTARQTRDLEAKVAVAVNKKLGTKGIEAALAKAKGTETEAQLTKMAEEQMLKDNTVKDEVKKIMMAELKKMKATAK